MTPHVGPTELRAMLDRAASRANDLSAISRNGNGNGNGDAMLDQVAPVVSPQRASPATEPGWPEPLQPAALRGLAGEVVATIGPHSEADPAALLLQYLLAFGNAARRGAGFRAEADFHATNLYVVLVGQTAKGRKGSSWGQIGRIFERADPDWRERRHKRRLFGRGTDLGGPRSNCRARSGEGQGQDHRPPGAGDRRRRQRQATAGRRI